MLRHFAKIRLAPRIPLDGEQLRNLLELKNIAHLYELWTYYRLVELISGLIGPPLRRAMTSPDDFGVALRRGRTFSWPEGIRLAYNPSFSPSRKPPRRSYSVSLRPDIALDVPTGINAGLHLLDAKFTVQGLREVGLDGADDEEWEGKTSERSGDFKRDDLYKMHTYRDAIPDANSVWILYPGSEFRFFDASNSGRVIQPPDLPNLLEGVGAIPFAPKPDAGPGPSPHSEVTATLRKLLGPHFARSEGPSMVSPP